MVFGITFFVNSILLGIGLAMDAFSVSLANGLNEPCMKKRKMTGIAGVFAAFQFLMPMLGWICVSTIAQHFKVFEQCIPWIALVLLGYIGIHMIRESKEATTCEEKTSTNLGALLVQGVATSIDALSVGFTIAHYHLVEALLSCFLIGVVTFFICFGGLYIGKKAGTRLAGKAGVLGGLILIGIGLEIFITGLF